MQICEAISYDHLTGDFFWTNISKYHNEKNNTKAGCINNGYRVIKINGKKYKAHRLAWFLHYGYWPKLIDHINGNKLDNRISNLRQASHTENSQNHKERTKGNGLPTGVSYTASGRYRARITVNKKVIYLGVYGDISSAKKAYRDARKQYHSAPSMEQL